MATSVTGLPFLLSEGMRVALVPPVLDRPRNVTVESLAMNGDDAAVVHFAEVTDAETAEALVGCYCLASRDDLGDWSDDAVDDLPDWSGWTVTDQVYGPLGTVRRIVPRPGQPLMELPRDGRDDLLVPLVDEIVVAVDEDRHCLITRIPDGLLEL